MIIKLSTAVGAGPTKLAAFDAALNMTGVANYNLVRLSSVIPPDTALEIVDGPIPDVPGGWGDRLYVVMAEMRADTPNEEAWAGIGWVVDKTTNKGLFVEHEGHSEASVRDDITESLQGLMHNRNVNFGEINMIVDGGMCDDRPICAFAVAVYQASDWENNPRLFKS